MTLKQSDQTHHAKRTETRAFQSLGKRNDTMNLFAGAVPELKHPQRTKMCKPLSTFFLIPLRRLRRSEKLLSQSQEGQIGRCRGTSKVHL